MYSIGFMTALTRGAAIDDRMQNDLTGSALCIIYLDCVGSKKVTRGTTGEVVTVRFLLERYPVWIV